jgi:hypothetical protein
MQIDKSYIGCFNTDEKKLAKRSHKPTAIVIHHTCTASPKKTRSALKAKGYSPHFEVDVDGHVYQYADIMEVACHCGSANVHAIGIDVTHMHKAAFPQRQVDAVKELVSMLCVEYDIPQVVHLVLEGIWPHLALGNTVCPDRFPMEALGELVTMERDELALLVEMVDIACNNGRVSEVARKLGPNKELMEELKRQGFVT